MMKKIIWKIIIFIIGSVYCIDPIDVDLLQAVNMPGVRTSLVTFHTIQYFILVPLDTHYINSVRHGDAILFQRNNTTCLKIVTANDGIHTFVYLRVITQNNSDIYFRFYLPVHGPPLLGRMAPSLTTVNTLLRLLANSHPSLNPRGFNMFDNSDPFDEDEGEDSDSDGDDDGDGDGDDGGDGDDDGGDGGDNIGGGFGGEGGDGDGGDNVGDEIFGPAAIGAVDIALEAINEEGIQGMIGGLQHFVPNLPNIPEQDENSQNESEDVGAVDDQAVDVGAVGDGAVGGGDEEENYEMVQIEGDGSDDSENNEQEMGIDLTKYAGYFRIDTVPINQQTDKLEQQTDKLEQQTDKLEQQTEQDIDQKIVQDMEELDKQIQQEFGQGIEQFGQQTGQFGQGIEQFGQGLAPNLSQLLDSFLQELIKQQVNSQTQESNEQSDPSTTDTTNTDTTGYTDTTNITNNENGYKGIIEPSKEEKIIPELIEIEMESDTESEGDSDPHNEDKTNMEE